MLAVPFSLRRANSRRLLAGSPGRLPTRSRTLGREAAGARTGATPSTAKAAPKSTAWTSARGPTLTRPWP
eukprot:11059461-Alexandrium_andersonii.AAC.1